MTPIDLEGGGDEKPTDKKPTPPAEKKGPGRPSNDAKVRDLKSTIDEGLGELAEWIERKDPELAKELREGAPRMAKVLSARAGKHVRVAKVLGVLFAPDGPLALLRAFGPTVRTFGDRIGAWRDRNAGDKVLVDDAGYIVDAAGIRVLDHDTGQPIHHLHGVSGSGNT